MYKKIIQLFLLVFASALVNAQTITKGEYFIDTDPGTGNGISLTVSAGDSVDITPVISTTSLGAGFHRVYFRFCDSNGRWSHYEDRLFYVYDTVPPLPVSTSVQVASAEYFFDTDPGVGNGTPVSASVADSILIMNYSVSSTGLTEGFHRIYFRAKDVNNSWSHYEDRLFYVYDTVAPAVPDIQPQIASLEYYFDGTDPGVGNGIAFTPFAVADSVIVAENIDASALPLGTHQINVRAKDVNGNWSHTESRGFTVLICNVNTGVTATALTLTASSVGTGITYQWINCSDSTSIAGETNQSFTPGILGNFAVIINDNGCVDTSSCYLISTTVGLDEELINQQIQVSPNPFTSSTTITFSEEQKNTSIKVMNVLGECVFQSTINTRQSTIDMSSLSKGIYFVRIEDENRNVVNKKIIKE